MSPAFGVCEERFARDQIPALERAGTADESFAVRRESEVGWQPVRLVVDGIIAAMRWPRKLESDFPLSWLPHNHFFLTCLECKKPAIGGDADGEECFLGRLVALEQSPRGGIPDVDTVRADGGRNHHSPTVCAEHNERRPILPLRLPQEFSVFHVPATKDLIVMAADKSFPIRRKNYHWLEIK